MKTNPSDRPRFNCRLARIALSIFGDASAREPRGWGAGHLASCADCQRYFHAAGDLEFALRRDAAPRWQEAPAGLEQEIIRAVRQAAPEKSVRTPRRAWLSLAGAMACVAVAVLVYQRTPPPAISPPVAPGAATPVDSATLAAARQLIAAVPGDIFAQMQPEAQAILQADPLQGEVEAMKSDARAAVRFLARNFLPNAAEEPSTGE
jgi:predicted anti-sigma-YlaC factor YlaD